eukprot:364899-Chlamydomonas_euryale.AAC.45
MVRTSSYATQRRHRLRRQASVRSLACLPARPPICPRRHVDSARVRPGMRVGVMSPCQPRRDIACTTAGA